MWASTGAFLGGIVFLVLGALGLRHAERVDTPARA